MDALQKARLTVINHLMETDNLSSVNTANVKITVDNFTENAGDWTAVIRTSAHTDRNYRVSYSATSGRISLRTFTESDESSYWEKIEDSQPEITTGGEYYGTL